MNIFQDIYYHNDNMPNVKDFSLWYNSNVKMSFIRQWEEKGIRRVMDIFNKEIINRNTVSKD